MDLDINSPPPGYRRGVNGEREVEEWGLKVQKLANVHTVTLLFVSFARLGGGREERARRWRWPSCQDGTGVCFGRSLAGWKGRTAPTWPQIVLITAGRRRGDGGIGRYPDQTCLGYSK